MAKFLLGSVLFWCAMAAPLPAQAACVFPEGTRDSPERAAQVMLADADHIGLGVIRRRGDLTHEVAEEVEIIVPIKGPTGIVTMNMPVEDGIWMATAHLVSFEAPEGTLVFAVLHGGSGRAVISECTQQLFIRPGRDQVMAELFRLWRQGRPEGR